MGASFLLTAVVTAATAATLLFAKGPKSSSRSDMAPANLDAFRLTTAEEGTVIPRIFGTVRSAGNLLYYGNLVSTPEYEETSGGKGGSKKQKYLQGYHYYMDIWQGVGMGPLEIVKVYQDDRCVEQIECSGEEWNDGTGTFYPAEAGGYASRLPGVAHLWLRQLYLGLNVTNMPTLHFVTRFRGTIPLPDAILSNGVNPAAIIWQLLIDAGAKADAIDTPSFIAAAQFWKRRGYGLNIAFGKQQPVRDHIAQVLGYVDGWLIERADGTLSLRAPDPDAAPLFDLNEKDFLEASFTFKRASWETTWNDFSGKFIDASQDFTERTVTANNSASIQLLGMRRKKSVDLTAFIERNAAQHRLEEIRDVESYPAATFSFDVPREYASIEQGHVLSISHTRFGITGVRVRVLEVIRGSLTENRLSIQAQQIAQHTGGTFQPVLGVPSWAAPDLAPVPLTQCRVVELGRNPITGTEPALLVLAARETHVEEGMLVDQANTSGTDYTSAGILSNPWAQRGTLVTEYPASTLELDDEKGVLYQTGTASAGATRSMQNTDPPYAPVSRAELFDARRVALIDDELMLFQTVTLEGTDTVRLGGVVRGFMNTPIQSHTAGASIWIFQQPREGVNVISGGNIGTRYLKGRPISGGIALQPDQAEAIAVNVVGAARRPWPVAGVRAERSGSTVTLHWYPVDIESGGAGTRTELENEPGSAVWSGDFAIRIENEPWQAVAAPTYSLDRAGTFTVQIKARQLGYESVSVTISVGAEDGIYYA